MQITKSTHVTATEKRHLKAFLQSGRTEAKVNTKTYTILSGSPRGDKYHYQIRITTPTRNDYGERIFNHQTIELIVNK